MIDLLPGFKDMSHYERTYLLLIAIQTILLVWYAAETCRLRIAASRQIDMITAQNKLVAQQAETMMNALKLQEKQFQTSFEPMFDFHAGINATGVPYISVENMKENVSYTEFRCNLNYELALPQIGTSAPRSKRYISVQTGAAVFYFGIKYLTLLGETKTKVFEVTPQTGQSKELPEYEFRTLGHITIC